MAESNLHKLSKRGQSVWIDSLSRTMLDVGQARAADEGGRRRRRRRRIRRSSRRRSRQGDAYDEQLKELLETETDPKEIFLQLSARDVEAALDLLRAGARGEPAGRLRLVGGRPDARLRPRRRRSTRRCGCIAWLDRPNLYVKIPATKPGLGAIEDCIAHGKSINVTLIFSLQRYGEVVEAYLRGLERLVASRRRPVDGALGRELLRLARRHRGRQAARGDRHEGGARAARQARDREREARVRALPARRSQRPALGVPRRQGRDAAALPVGVDLDEEPGLPRRRCTSRS